MIERWPPRLQRWIARTVEQQVLSSVASLSVARADIAAADTLIGQLETRWTALRQALDAALAPVRFTPRTTVAQALALHPGVVDLLATYQLDRCERCPVRHDESLEELARGHDISLDQLLSRLDGLS